MLFRSPKVDSELVLTSYKSIGLIPNDFSTHCVTSSRYNEAYTWTNPTCCVHNIIVGQLWIEQYGNVEVINHRWGEDGLTNSAHTLQL